MNSNQTTINNLIRTISSKDPSLYSALQMLLIDVYAMYGEVFPQTSAALARAAGSVIPDDVTGVILTPFPTNLRISWDESADAVQYEVREGAVWDTARYVVTTSQLLVNIDPIVNNLVIGNHTFLVKAISQTGNYSLVAGAATLTVPVINPPILTGSAISNNAILNWTEPSSMWEISYYIVKRDGLEIGYIDGNFTISSEIVAGLYSYTVQAVDIVGNVGLESAPLELQVEDPIDLVFIDSINATLNGIYTNTFKGVVDGVTGVLGAIPAHTYQQHFTTYGFASPQAQVSAGYPEWLSPTGTTGTYQEVFDFGSIFNNLTINVVYSKINLFGSTNVTTSIEYSTDNVTWTPPVVANAILATTFRYVRVTWNFNNSDDHSLAFIYNMRVTLNTQLILDSGSGTTSTSTSGLTVTTNKVYKQINSITLTSGAVNPIDLVYSNIVINPATPASFRVHAFDNAGNRVAVNFSWKTRGVV